MKVVILSNLFPPNSKGGAEEVAKAEALKYKKEGWEAVVITLSPLNKKCVQEINRLKIYFLQHKNIFNYFNIDKKSIFLRFIWHIIDTFNFWLTMDIKKILENEKPDLVICHNLTGLSYLTPVKIAKLKIENYTVIHDVSLYTPSGLIWYGKENAWEHRGLLTRIYRFFTRRLFSYSNKVYFPSHWLMNFYNKNDFFKKQEKIYRTNHLNFNAPSSVKGDREGFLFVGQLELHKGILFLLDAFHNVESPTLYIVGDGSLLEEVKKRAENNSNIKIYGRLTESELAKFYQRTKAILVPSLVYENSPNVIVEALGCGAKVVASRLGGISEMIKEGENGYTFIPGNAGDLLEKIKLIK